MPLAPPAARCGRLAFACVLTLFATPAAAQSPTRRIELAGESLPGFPHFQYVRSFLPDNPVEIGIDPHELPHLVGSEVDVYVVAARTPLEWSSQPELIDVRGQPQRIEIAPRTIVDNRTSLDPGTLPGPEGQAFAAGYDIVLDVDLDGELGAVDVLDGGRGGPGFFVVRQPFLPGPHESVEITYSGGSLLAQNTFYPADIAELGELPLIVISHGNGHEYTWYDHLGRHLASHGFIVMSHENNTGPGPNAASLTTLTNIDYLMDAQGDIADGALDGHIDIHRMAWIGHSRGGEGVVRAYTRLLLDQYSSPHFDEDDVQLVSSMAPTVFLKPVGSFPGDVNYHLLFGSADSDVTGGADSPVVQAFTYYERASGAKQLTYMQGLGHGWMHNGLNECFCEGPDIVKRGHAHRIQRAYYLALASLYLRDEVSALDFFERTFEDFHPPTGLDTHVLTTEYRPAPEELFVLDDFETEPSVGLSSAGTSVVYEALNLVEGRFEDVDGKFKWKDEWPMNGMTRSAYSEDSQHGVVFDFEPEAPATFEVRLPKSERDLTDDVALLFRACQGTRHPITDLVDGRITFGVTLRDTAGASSTILTDNYGSLTRPYLRDGLGAGVGWANEFMTIRIPLADFGRDGARLDLQSIEAVRFEFGPRHGSERGRVGLDDIAIQRRAAKSDVSIAPNTKAVQR